MATDVVDEDRDLETEIVDEQESVDVPEQEAEDTESESDEAADSDEGVQITLGEEESPVEEHRNPNLVKTLRRVARDKDKVIKDLEAKLKAVAPEDKPVALTKKPDMADDNINWDPDKFEAALLEWNEKKRKIEASQQEARKRKEQEDAEWKALHENYGKAKAALKLRDYEDAEDVVKQMFNETQQALILAGASRPAELVYALGKRPAEAEKLSKITNQVRFAVELGKLEGMMKVTPRNEKPLPERGAPRSAGTGGVVTTDRRLAELEKDALRTGDRTKIREYHRDLRERSSKK